MTDGRTARRRRRGALLVVCAVLLLTAVAASQLLFPSHHALTTVTGSRAQARLDAVDSVPFLPRNACDLRVTYFNDPGPSRGGGSALRLTCPHVWRFGWTEWLQAISSAVVGSLLFVASSLLGWQPSRPARGRRVAYLLAGILLAYAAVARRSSTFVWQISGGWTEVVDSPSFAESVGTWAFAMALGILVAPAISLLESRAQRFR